MSEVSEDGSGSPVRTRSISATHLGNISEVLSLSFSHAPPLPTLPLSSSASSPSYIVLLAVFFPISCLSVLDD